MRSAVRQRAIAEVDRRCARCQGWVGVADGAGAALRPAVAFSRAAWYTLDPLSLLVTGARTLNVPPVASRQLVRLEYERPDPLAWRALVSSSRRCDTLLRAMNGQPSGSDRFRTVLAPLGVADELRVALVARDECWGALALYRDAHCAPFSSDETELVGRLGATLGESFRRARLKERPELAPPLERGAIALVDDRDLLVGSSDGLFALFAELSESDELGEGELPAAAIAAAARARATAQHDEPSEARSLVRSSAGRWLSLHARALRGTGSPLVAVVIELARPDDVAPVLLSSHALSVREREVVGLVARGQSTKEIARELRITSYTAQDHLRAIYRKFGVSTRRELVAKFLGASSR